MGSRTETPLILPLRDSVGRYFMPVEPSLIQELWPNLTTDKSSIKSEPNRFYNCAAFLIPDEKNKWWPIALPGYYWPPGFPLDDTTETILATFEKLFGFVRCGDGDYEQGFEKIAIYEKDGSPVHIAKQTASGKWVCKMGPLDDIEYDTVSVLDGPEYGSAVVFAKKRI